MSDSEGYRIKQQLGAGLAGPVFLAETASGNVVVRQFKSQAQPGSSLRSAERNHFLQAATGAAALVQPGVVRVLEVIDEGDEAFEVMEYVPYETLKDALDTKVFSVDESNQIIRGLANILHGVHQSGLTHGDLKPSNVFLLPKRELKISDFGISPRARRELGTMPPEWNHAYLAPEHFSNRTALGPRSDQFSLAAIAYHMYTGQLPFRQPGSSIVTDRGQLRSVSEMRSEIPWAVDSVLAKALSVEPQERYASCLQFLYYLEASLVPSKVEADTGYGLEKPSSSRRLWPIAVAVLLLLLGALATFLFTKHRDNLATKPQIAASTPMAAAPVGIAAATTTPRAASTQPKKKPVNRATVAASDEPAPRPKPAENSSSILQKVSVAQTPVNDSPAEKNQTLDLQIYSRKHKVEENLTFGFKDPTFGEMASGDLSAIVRGTVPKGKLRVDWFQDDVKMDSKPVVLNQYLPYDNEPTPGLYKVVLMVNSKPFKQFIFRITE